MAWRVIVQTDHARMTDDLFVVQDNAMGSGQLIVKPLELVKRDRSQIAEPTHSFDEGTADELLQAFADAAWERGIQPRQIEDQRNQVKAMESHLVDLRRVSFKLLKIEP